MPVGIERPAPAGRDDGVLPGHRSSPASPGAGIGGQRQIGVEQDDRAAAARREATTRPGTGGRAAIGSVAPVGCAVARFAGAVRRSGGRAAGSCSGALDRCRRPGDPALAGATPVAVVDPGARTRSDSLPDPAVDAAAAAAHRRPAASWSTTSRATPPPPSPPTPAPRWCPPARGRRVDRQGLGLRQRLRRGDGLAAGGASGDLVFLDADVRLDRPDVLDRLVGRGARRRPTRWCPSSPGTGPSGRSSSSACCFNITALMGSVAFTALGTRVRPTLAFGPVLACSAAAYEASGGHAHPDGARRGGRGHRPGGPVPGRRGSTPAGPT